MVEISIKGMDNLRKNVEALGPRAQNAFEEGIIAEVAKVMRKAYKLVPIYTGSLQGSAFLRERKTNDSRDITFGYDEKYAVFVHEHPNGHMNGDGHPCGCYATIHRPRPGQKRNGQGYKWLEKAINSIGQDFIGAVQRRVRSAVMRANGDRGRRPTLPVVVKAPASPGGGGGGGSSVLKKLIDQVAGLKGKKGK